MGAELVVQRWIAPRIAPEKIARLNVLALDAELCAVVCSADKVVRETDVQQVALDQKGAEKDAPETSVQKRAQAMVVVQNAPA